MQDTYCVIGDPIAHSLSPAIYNTLFAMHGMPGKHYGKERVTQETLPGFVESLVENGIAGFNITMPLKEDILPYLFFRDESVRFGANTVTVKGGKLYGYSTDAAGFRKSLSLHDRSWPGAHVTFLGCGGAARALIDDALREKAARVVILNRTPGKAAEFAVDPRVAIGTLSDAPSFLPACDLLINATPLGMQGVNAQFSDLSFLSLLPKDAFVADLIYQPDVTLFLEQAARLGHETMNGLWMLIWQAFYAFEKYAGILPDMDAFDAVRAVLREKLRA